MAGGREHLPLSVGGRPNSAATITCALRISLSVMITWPMTQIYAIARVEGDISKSPLPALSPVQVPSTNHTFSPTPPTNSSTMPVTPVTSLDEFKKIVCIGPATDFPGRTSSNRPRSHPTDQRRQARHLRLLGHLVRSLQNHLPRL